MKPHASQLLVDISAKTYAAVTESLYFNVALSQRNDQDAFFLSALLFAGVGFRGGHHRCDPHSRIDRRNFLLRQLPTTRIAAHRECGFFPLSPGKRSLSTDSRVHGPAVQHVIPAAPDRACPPVIDPRGRGATRRLGRNEKLVTTTSAYRNEWSNGPAATSWPESRICSR